MHLRKTAALAAVAVGAALSLAACGSSTASTSSSSATGSRLTVYADTVTNQGCIQTNVFHRGVDILVWRINVLKNGQQDKSAKVSVQVRGGQTYKAPWNTKDHFYTAAWVVPFSQPTGTIQYTVTATDGSQTATYQPQFMVAPSELMIVPATYSVTATVGSETNSQSVFAASASIPVFAKVTYPTDSGSASLTAGKVVAEIGQQGNVDSHGNLVAAKTVTLSYRASAKAWTASIPASGLAAGLYVVQVNAQDGVNPPNTGSSTSPAFEVQ